MSAKSKKAAPVQLRLRVMAGKEIAMGPGKAQLLGLVRDTGSISEAARQLEMSYMRAWLLIQTMNRCFREPVIQTARGGRKQGGASLTKTGEKILALYERLNAECLATSKKTCNDIAALLKKSA